jgi:hypothetical protein
VKILKFIKWSYKSPPIKLTIELGLVSKIWTCSPISCKIHDFLMPILRSITWPHKYMCLIKKSYQVRPAYLKLRNWICIGRADRSCVPSICRFIQLWTLQFWSNSSKLMLWCTSRCYGVVHCTLPFAHHWYCVLASFQYSYCTPSALDFRDLMITFGFIGTFVGIVKLSLSIEDVIIWFFKMTFRCKQMYDHFLSYCGVP